MHLRSQQFVEINKGKMIISKKNYQIMFMDFIKANEI